MTVRITLLDDKDGACVTWKGVTRVEENEDFIILSGKLKFMLAEEGIEYTLTKCKKSKIKWLKVVP